MEKEPILRPKEFSEEARSFKSRVDQLNLSGGIDRSIEIMDDVAVKVQELLKTYSDEEIRKTELFHVVSGSSLLEGVEHTLDLPGGEFAAFIEELEKKYITG